MKREGGKIVADILNYMIIIDLVEAINKRLEVLKH